MGSSKPDDPFPEYFYQTGPLNTDAEVIETKRGTFWKLNVSEALNEEPEADSSTPYLPPYEDNEDGIVDCAEIDDEFIIRPSKNDSYTVAFYVPKPLQSAIIGVKGQKIKELQERTRTKIAVPRMNQTGLVKIDGRTERDVASCLNQVQMVLLNRRKRMQITHFLSVPIQSDEITENFNKFKECILNGTPYRGVDELIFQKVNKLHLTVTVLLLLDETAITEAKQLMKQCHKTILLTKFPSNKTYRFKIGGISIMNDDSRDVNVLYGNVKMDDDCLDKFQSVCNEITALFSRKNFTKDRAQDTEQVKLHLTLMNTKYRMEQNSDQKRVSFDASNILKKYKDFHFGYAEFRCMQLSVSSEYDENGFYKSLLTLTLQ